MGSVKAHRIVAVAGLCCSFLHPYRATAQSDQCWSGSYTYTNDPQFLKYSGNLSVIFDSQQWRAILASGRPVYASLKYEDHIWCSGPRARPLVGAQPCPPANVSGVGRVRVEPSTSGAVLAVGEDYGPGGAKGLGDSDLNSAGLAWIHVSVTDSAISSTQCAFSGQGQIHLQRTSCSGSDGSTTTSQQRTSGYSQPVTATAPKVVDFNLPENRRDGSHVVTFSPPPLHSTAASSTSAQMDSLLGAVDNIHGSNGDSQAVANSLTTALDRQLDVGNSPAYTPNTAQVSPAGAGQSRQQAAQDLAQRLLDRGAALLTTTPDPLEVGASAVVGEHLSGKLVDTLVDQLDNLGIDQSALKDPFANALFQINRAMNPFNLRKGTYEYNKGIMEALTNALDVFFPPNQ